GGGGVAVMGSPIDVAGPLREMLFDDVPTVILTSATLAVRGGFEFVRARLGVDEADELVLESPFEPDRQAVLYLPQGLPEPREESFMTRYVEQVRSLLRISAGRAFLLFTSFVNLKRARAALGGRIPWPRL